jgi:molecular chaperone GrpE (heat shock protein)
MNKDDLLRRFEHWLDDTLGDEAPPTGVDAELIAALATADGLSDAALQPPTDAYALWSAMTALTHEVKLQGRTFKELHAAIEAGRSEDAHAACRMREREAERRTRRDTLGALLDVRDALARGLDVARAADAVPAGPGWLARLVPSRSRAQVDRLAALTKGYELGLGRLDQLLDDLQARPIAGQGEPFDPRRMNAIDKEESVLVPPGTVLKVYRTGYEWGGDVFRPAQVKVSCAPASRATP